MKRTVRAGRRVVEYTLISAHNRANLLLQALPEGKIRVYAPATVRVREVDTLVLDRLSWLDEMHANMDAERAVLTLTDGQTFMLEGRPLTLRLREGARNTVERAADTLTLTTTRADAGTRAAVLKEWLARLALMRIRERLDQYSPGIGKRYGRVTIREQRTRWGSCSSLHNLNFNWKLILAPEPALTYVVIHELCHLIDFNHSPKFWSEVRKRMPDYELWKSWLKTHGKALTFF